MLSMEIYLTKGGPPGSAILSILFCYYFNKALEKIIIKEKVFLKTYAV